jgi:hypothetical protein
MHEVSVFLRKATGSIGWWWGDYLNALDNEKTDTWALQYAEMLGVHPQTIRDYRRVAAYYPIERRIDVMSFEHHRTAMAVAPVERSLEWVVKAQADSLSVPEMRKEMRIQMAGVREPDTTRPDAYDGMRELSLTSRWAKREVIKARAYPPEQARALLLELRPIIQLARELGHRAGEMVI